ncbi:hypothetical protein ACS0TY_027854 [Phlomoides rotata]
MDGRGIGEVDPEKGKTTRGRRSWTKIEEDALIRCLQEIVSDGWKADNGFKAGFQRELEKWMKKLLPGTDILATPHINSKIHVWKKEYAALSDLLTKSGIGWNSSTCQLDILDESVWDAQKKADSHVKTLRFKSWPYYEKWLDIFGKDRATGEQAADPIDLVNELLRGSDEQEGDTTDKVDPQGLNPEELLDGNASVCKPSAFASKGKKRKSMDGELSSFVSTLGDYMKSTDDSFSNLAQRMGTDYDAKIARTNLNEIMKGIPFLSLQDKLKVLDELVQNNSHLDLFMTLPANEQAEYVWMLLDGRLS